MKVTFLCIGKLKEKYLKLAVNEYTKRLSRYCKINIVEVQDEKAPDKMSEKEEIQIKIKEGGKILRYIKEGDYVIALAIEGEMMSSIELAQKVEILGVQGNSHIVFIIGGSLGLSKEVLDRAHFLLSFSRMTFPHQLMRVILLEQVYRSYRIINGEPYHK